MRSRLMDGDHAEKEVRGAVCTMSVVVAAYTMQRWQLLVKCIDSICSQTLDAKEIILCIDNNEELYLRAADRWRGVDRVRVIRNPDTQHTQFVSAHERAHGTKRRFGAGSARNAAVNQTTSNIVAIIDDDACAEPNWLATLRGEYEASPHIVAVGGPPIPVFESRRPGWFPHSFDWVFGCAYEGLPTQPGPIRHLIGANLSFRRSAFDKVGGFGSIDFDDLDLCMKLSHEFGFDSLRYTPYARVHHFVPTPRVSWSYFWRRCLYVNTEKVEAFAEMAEAANLKAELRYGLRTSTISLARECARGVRGDLNGFRAGGAIVAGLALAVAGNLRGRWRIARRHAKSRSTD